MREEKFAGSDFSHKKRRSRSRDREKMDQRSRDRYDSSDRRKFEAREGTKERRNKVEPRKKKSGVEITEVRESESDSRGGNSSEKSRNLELPSENKNSDTSISDGPETSNVSSQSCKKSEDNSRKWPGGRNRKRAHSFEKRDSSSDDDNIPEQYRTSNFSCQAEKKIKS